MARRRSHSGHVQELGAPRLADGVEYIASDAAPGLKLFHCRIHDASLSTKGCASRWAAAQMHAVSPIGIRSATGRRHDEDERDGMAGCRSCPIGAAHAGGSAIFYSALYGKAICPRCTTGATRMIFDQLCVSCYNRQREKIAGVNSKGTAPVKHRPLRSLNYHLVVDGRPRRATAQRVVGGLEVAVQAMRTTTGHLAFAYRGYEGALRQGRLF